MTETSPPRGRPAWKQATGTEVAQIANVSQSTVSLVLSGKWPGRVSQATADIVLDAARSLGYAPNLTARNLRLGSTKTIALLTPVLGNSFFANIHEVLAQKAATDGINVIVYPLNATDETTPLPTFNHVVDGIIGCSLDFEQVGAMSGGIPMVLIDSDPASPAITINSDVAGGAHETIANLAGLGHQSVTHLAANHATWTFQERGRGLAQACMTYGLDLVTIHVRPTTIDTFTAAIKILSKSPAPTAIVCDTDQMAIAVYMAARRTGVSIPDDMSVVGFDDREEARLQSPSLTTVRIAAITLGEFALVELRKIMHGQTGTSNMIKAPLIVRNSTAAPPKRASASRRQGISPTEPRDRFRMT